MKMNSALEGAQLAIVWFGIFMGTFILFIISYVVIELVIQLSWGDK